MKNLAISAVLFALAPSVALAQSYYDDDIYYDADRAKQEKEEALRKRVQANYVPNQAVDYPGADTYTVNSGSTRDVDEYNRRNLPYATDTLKYHADGTESFACTRDIERFHNPEVVSGSADEDLQYLYYTEQQQPQTSVNIYVDGLYWNPYRYGYRSYWAFYDPWYSWSWGWGPYYDPYWSWGWGPSWSWGWGPGWYPGGCWGPGWGPAPMPGHGWGPAYAPSGASRPHYDYAGGYRPSYGRRDGVSTSRPVYAGQQATAGKRPQQSTGSVTVPSGKFNPSYETRTGRRPGGYGTSTSGSSNGGYRYGGSSSGSRGNSYGTSSGGRRSNSYNSNSSSHRSSNSGYRQGSSGGSRSSGGSYGGGRSGGGHRSGGGGGRGRH